MSKKSLFFILLTAVILTALFSTYEDGGYKNFLAQLATALSNNASSSSSNSAASSSALALIDVLDTLQNQQQLLSQQITEMNSKLELIQLKDSFIRQIKRGDSGDDVAKLQEILSQIPDVYATTSISGFYGRLTEQAVIKFQQQEELNPSGIVDSATVNKLYEAAANSADKENVSAELTPIDMSSITDLQFLQNLETEAGAPGGKPTLQDMQNEISQLSENVSAFAFGAYSGPYKPKMAAKKLFFIS